MFDGSSLELFIAGREKFCRAFADNTARLTAASHPRNPECHAESRMARRIFARAMSLEMPILPSGALKAP
jgi:hypothetical protein